MSEQNDKIVMSDRSDIWLEPSNFGYLELVRVDKNFFLTFEHSHKTVMSEQKDKNFFLTFEQNDNLLTFEHFDRIIMSDSWDIWLESSNFGQKVKWYQAWYASSPTVPPSSELVSPPQPSRSSCRNIKIFSICRNKKIKSWCQTVEISD